MKKRLALVLCLGLTWSMMTIQPATTWSRPQGPCSDPAYRTTRTMSLEVRQDRAEGLIRCVFGWLAPDQTQMALTIAGRESGLDAFAWNRSTDCRGLFQHLQTYWPGRVRVYLRERWFPNTWPDVSAFNGRANTIAAARMVRANGWSAWSTA